MIRSDATTQVQCLDLAGFPRAWIRVSQPLIDAQPLDHYLILTSFQLTILTICSPTILS